MGNLALSPLETVKTIPLTAVPLLSIETKQDHAICQAVSAITTLAILNKSVLHIFAEYSPNVSYFSIRVIDSNAIYRGDFEYTFRSHIDLDLDDALSSLMKLEDKLIDLIADAKDKLMGGV